LLERIEYLETGKTSGGPEREGGDRNL
jgi:hypothetical protein